MVDTNLLFRALPTMIIVTQKDGRRPVRLLKRIRAAVQAGKSKKVKWLVGEWLRSFEAKRLAARLARRKIKAGYRPTQAELDSLAATLDPYVPSKEEVLVNVIRKEKDPGDFRHTMDFGIE